MVVCCDPANSHFVARPVSRFETNQPRAWCVTPDSRSPFKGWRLWRASPLLF